ncbi:MAG: triple tyrosine motif-containing protein [Saprospiraceae bacterium]
MVFLYKIVLKKALFAALFGLAAVAIPAQPDAISFERYGLKDGLPDELARDFAADTFGFLWVLHRDGISRFDGFKFKNYSLPNNPSNNHLVCDRANRIWVIANDQLYRFDRRTDMFSKVTLPDSTFGGQMAFLPTPDGNVWFRRRQGLFRIGPTDLAPVLVSAKVPISRRDHSFGDSKGRFWFSGCDFLLIRLDLQQNRLDSFPFDPLGCAHQWFEDPKTGMIWVSTWTFGLVEVNPETGESKSYKAPPTMRNIFFGFTLFPELTGDRILWCNAVNGEEGIWLFDLDKKRFLKNYPHEPLNPYSPPGKDLGGVWRDSIEGILWISAHPDGIASCNPRKQQFQVLNWPGGFGGNNVRFIWSEHPQALERSVFTYDQQHITLKQPGKNEFSKLPYRQFGWVKDDYMFLPLACRDAQNRLWIFVPTGLYLMDEANWRILKKWNLPFARNRKDGSQGFVIDQAGNFWLAWMNEVWKFYPTEGRFQKITEVALPDEVADPEVAPDGSIWVVATQSILRLDTRTGEKRVFPLPQPKMDSIPPIVFGIKQIDFDKKTGLVWAASTWGLFRLNPATGETTFFPIVWRGVFPNCRGLRFDDFGKIWAPTYRGLVRFDPETGQHEFFTSFNGLFANAQQSIFKTGRLLYSVLGNGVLQEINPYAFDQEEKPLRAFITGFRILDKPQRFDWDSVTTHPFEIHSRQNRLTFEFSAPDFYTAGQLLFEYKLEGFHEDWIKNGSERTANFTNLAPGHYVFRVRTRHDFSQNWSKEGVFKLYVRPAFYQTNWFYTLCVLGIGVFFYALFGFRLRAQQLALEKKQREAERNELLLQSTLALQHERDRIAAEMHDELGGGLSTIHLASSRAQKMQSPEETQAVLARVSQIAIALVGNMRGIVWAMDTQNDSLDSLLSYLRQYAHQFLADNALTAHIEIPDEIPDIPLSGQYRHNVLLTLKECLNNIVKHAEASEVWLTAGIAEGELIITLRDNGKGFDPEAVVGKGKGLRSVVKRMEGIGGSIRWERGEEPAYAFTRHRLVEGEEASASVKTSADKTAGKGTAVVVRGPLNG